MRIVRYSPDRQEEWDNFIESSRNGTFLFMRGYMDYHSDRFKDHSLMYYSDKGKLLSVMAANEVVTADGGRTLHSHQGLTYGGFVLSQAVRMVQVMDVFDMTVAYLKELGFKEWYYKQIPVCYHRLPSQEDEYALWRLGAEIVECGVSSDIVLDKSASIGKPIESSTKKYDCSRLLKKGYTVERQASIEQFWQVLIDNLLMQHNVAPTHSLDEIQLLQSRYPDKIECVVARNERDGIEAGTVIYKMKNIVHTQYMAASEEGRRNNAMDFLMLSLIEQFREGDIFKILDFGISTEDKGRFLNEGLITYKEGCGGRGIVYKQYLIRL